jgi:hypothetical protein
MKTNKKGLKWRYYTKFKNGKKILIGKPRLWYQPIWFYKMMKKTNWTVKPIILKPFITIYLIVKVMLEFNNKVESRFIGSD